MQRRFFTTVPLLLMTLVSFFLVGCSGPTLMDRLNYPWGAGFCGILILIFDVIALLEVAGSNRTFGSKVLWALLIFFFPVGGVIFYYFFGRK